MALEFFCGPALLYLGFSLVQIVIDIYKGMYNTTFVKFIVMIIFTTVLNILCKSGLTVISWLIVFIPFISMTIITTLLLFVFGLDPTSGNLNYAFYDFENNGIINTQTVDLSSGNWKILYADGTIEYISITNYNFILNGESYTIIQDSPMRIEWSDGTIQTLKYVDETRIIRWTTDHPLPKYNYIIWEPLD